MRTRSALPTGLTKPGRAIVVRRTSAGTFEAIRICRDGEEYVIVESGNEKAVRWMAECTQIVDPTVRGVYISCRRRRLRARRSRHHESDGSC